MRPIYVPEPVTLLTQPLLGALLRQLQSRYDAVILDAPPYGILADTDLLAAQSDIALYVVRAGRIQQSHMRRIQHLTRSGKLPPTAVVLNAVNFRTAAYSYYGYGYGHYHHTAS